MRPILILLSFFLSFNLFGQDKPEMLLMNTDVQFECADAVNDMYNFKFDRAEKQFQILKLKYPDHPLPYFLMALSTWWKIMPNIDVKTYDDTFIAYLDTAIVKADKMYENNNTKIEAAFFLSAAYGFKSELYGDRSSYAKATFAGKSTLKYLLDYKDNNDLSPEFLYGVSLYNYYEVWIKEEYPLLKPIMMFFPNGNKKEGLKQLEEASQQAFYTRTEAQNQLVKIYTSAEEDKDELALPIAKYLHETYPDNPYFHRNYARCAYYTHSFHELEPICLDILKRIDNGMLGYEEVSGRYASYFLGKIYKERNNIPKAKEYFLKAKFYAEKIGDLDQGFYLFSLQNLAEFAVEEKNPELAKEYYKLIKKNVPRSDDEDFKKLRKEAKKGIRKNKKVKATKTKG